MANWKSGNNWVMTCKISVSWLLRSPDNLYTCLFIVSLCVYGCMCVRRCTFMWISSCMESRVLFCVFHCYLTLHPLEINPKFIEPKDHQLAGLDGSTRSGNLPVCATRCPAEIKLQTDMDTSGFYIGSVYPHSNLHACTEGTPLTKLFPSSLFNFKHSRPAQLLFATHRYPIG